jgi:5-methyltetrahydropteroyltriglutamate--homocysteine methyltransferase
VASAAPHDPPFRADPEGSLLRPPELKKLRNDYAAGRISAYDLQSAEDDAAICTVVAQQEQAGPHSITDGEFRREDFYTHFFVEVADEVWDHKAGSSHSESLGTRHASSPN